MSENFLPLAIPPLMNGNLLEKIVRARAVALGGLTSFSNTLAAFNADPKGQRSNLSRAVKEMQNIMRQINNDIFKSEAAQIGKITGKVREEIHDLKWSEVIKGREAPRMKRLPAMTRPPSSTPQQKTPKTWNDAIKFAGLEETELDKLTKEVLTDIRS